MKLKQVLWALACTLTIEAYSNTEVLYQTGFEKNDPVKYSVKPGTLSKSTNITALSGNNSLYGNSLNSEYEFNDLLKTSLQLHGNAIYEAEFDYQILSSKSDGHLFALFASPTSTWSDSATGYTTLTQKQGHAKIRSVLTPLRNDFEFILFCYGKAEVLIDNLKISRISETPVLNNTATSLPPQNVSGAIEPQIIEPRNTNKQTISVADFGASPQMEDNSAAFAKAINAAKSTRTAVITVPTGTYKFYNFSWSALLFDGQQDLTFDGQGSTFLFYSSDKEPTYITINKCTRCVFKNFSMDWNFDTKPISSIAKITSVNRDSGIIDIELNQTFKNRDSKMEMNLLPINNKTLEPGRYNETHLQLENYEWLSDHQIKAKLKNHDKNNPHPAPGDHYAAIHCHWTGQAINVIDCENLTFDKVNIYSSPGYGFRIAKTNLVRLDNCKVTLPPNAKPQRVVSTNSDAIDFLNCNQGGFIIENSEFSHSGDDFINLNSTSLCGLKPDSSHSIIAKTDFPNHSYKVGETIEFRNYDFSPLGFQSTVTARQPLNATEVKVTFKDKLPDQLPAQTIFFMPNFKMENFVIRNNYFHHGYCRGVLPCGKNATIENNVFEKNTMPDLLIINDFLTRYRIEGNGISNLLIRNNTFKNSNVMCLREGAAAIQMPMWRPSTWYPITTAIEIANNKFINPAGAVLFTSSVNGLNFHHNTTEINRKDPSQFVYSGSVILGQCSTNFSITDNIWKTSATSTTLGVITWSEGNRNISLKNNQITNQLQISPGNEKPRK